MQVFQTTPIFIETRAKTGKRMINVHRIETVTVMPNCETQIYMIEREWPLIVFDTVEEVQEKMATAIVANLIAHRAAGE